MLLHALLFLLITPNGLAQVNIATELISVATTYAAIESTFATGALIDTADTTIAQTDAVGLVTTPTTVLGVAATTAATATTTPGVVPVPAAATLATTSDTPINTVTAAITSSTAAGGTAAQTTNPTTVLASTLTTRTAAPAAGASTSGGVPTTKTQVTTVIPDTFTTTSNTFSQDGLASNGLSTTDEISTSEDNTSNTVTLTGAMTSVSIGPGYDSTIGASGSIMGPSASYHLTNGGARVENGVGLGFILSTFWLMYV